MKIKKKRKGIIPTILLSFIGCLLFISCESENIEEKYYSNNNNEPGNTTENPVLSSGLLAWFPMNGSVQDSSINNTPVILAGNATFVDGINEEHGKGLYLEGNSYLIVDLGYYDTISIAFWIKGDGELESSNTPTLFDYGFNTLSAKLDVDGSTGATSLTVKKNENISCSKENSSIEYLNSFTKYSLVYVEAGGDKTKVYFKGYTSSGDETVYSDELNFPGIIDTESELLYIGRSSQKENIPGSFFKGSIDEIYIFNKTLSNAEIQQMALIPTR